MAELPNKELRDAIKAAAVAAEVADPVFATAKAIEAYTKGEFADADQATSWFDLQRVKSPKLWETPEVDASGAEPGATNKTKDASNPWSPNFKGPDRTKAIADWIRKFGSASASRMAASQNVDLAGRELRAR